MKALILFIGLFAFAITTYAQNIDTSNVANKDTITSPEHLDSPPDFPGGMIKFNEYIKKNYKLSKFDIGNHRGEIGFIDFVRFVVEKDGSLTNFESLRAATPDTQTEDLRIMKASPKWKPAMAGGKPCRAKYTARIRYQTE